MTGEGDVCVIAKTGRPSKPKTEVVCTACGAKFEKYDSEIARNKTGRFFCTIECSRKVGAKPRRGNTHICAQCGNNFYRRAADTSATYCSPECHNFARSNKVTRVCPTCDNAFIRSPSDKARFCSLECSGHANTKTDIVCEHCKNIFRGRPQEGRRFCSKTCFYAHQTKYAQGHVNSDGYRRRVAPDGSYMLEHRIVMEQMLGRKLTRQETVHHRDGNRLNNTPDNLELWTGNHGNGVCEDDLVTWAEQLLRDRKPDALA